MQTCYLQVCLCVKLQAHSTGSQPNSNSLRKQGKALKKECKKPQEAIQRELPSPQTARWLLHNVSKNFKKD